MNGASYKFKLTYKDKEEVVLFVSEGIGNGAWGTFYRKANGSLKRLQRSALLMRDTFEQAQRDLDDFALQHELETAEMDQVEATITPPSRTSTSARRRCCS